MNQRLTIPHSRTVSGLLLAVSPFAILLAAGLQEARWIDLALWQIITSSASALLLVMASLLVMRRSPAAVATTIAGTVAGIAPVYEVFIARPGVSLLVFMGVCYLFFATFPIKRINYKPTTPGWNSSAQAFFRGTLFGYGTLWGMLLVADWPFSRYIVTELFAASTLVPCIAGAVWIISEFKDSRKLRWRPLAAVLVVASGSLAGLLHDSSWLEAVGVIGIATAILIVDERVSIEDRSPWWRLVAGHPERLLFSTFLILCACGAVLLSLTVSTAPDTNISILDAIFTAVSAVCVTGLIVLDTPHDFTFAGQLFILVLIQAGGLGIMTFSTAAIRLLGRKMSLRHEAAVARLLSSEDRNRVFDSTRDIIRFTIAAELAGAVLLTFGFLIDGDSFGPALWRGIFTSISAFCNAGFALQTDSLIPYVSNPLVLHSVGLLIIMGGLSPVVVLAIPQLFRKNTRMSPQLTVVLVTTVVLLLFAFTMFLFAEWNGSLAHLSFMDRLNNAWFQSVTLRTAGFNSVDISALAPGTYITSLLMMFIGGSPGGTAGGIKTTTIAILFLSIVGTVRGRSDLRIFRFSIAQESRHKATSIFMVASTLAFVAILGLSLTQALPLESIVFEVISAIGTVGLTIGATGELDGIGKLVIIVCMFLGRIGPLSMFLLINQRTLASRMKRPDARIDVG